MKALVTNAAEEGGVIAARSLAAAGFDVIGVDTRAVPRLARSRYLSDYLCVGAHTGSEMDGALMRAVDAVRPDVFLPIGTRGTAFASVHRGALASRTALNVVAADVFLRAFDKLECRRTCRTCGVACPDFFSPDEALSIAEAEPDRTLVVKPRWDVGASAGVSYARGAAGVHAAVAACTRDYGECLVEDFIPGATESMKTAMLLFDREGMLAAAFTSRKVRQWPQTGGVTVVSRSTAERDLVDGVLPFFRAVGWRGPAEVELKRDARDGRDKVVEINPRFPGYARFPYHCGLDFPSWAARLALGEPAPATMPDYRVGETYLAPTLFLRTLREDARTSGTAYALRRARTDARGAGPIVRSMLADPLPLLLRMCSSAPDPSPPAIATLTSLRAAAPQ